LLDSIIVILRGKESAGKLRGKESAGK